MRRILVVIAWLVVLVGGGARAHAETIAMLPLDGEKRLEIYGQPVAAEIARALKAAGLDVVVVGARMNVPDGAQLIVDGTIKGKGKEITLSIRVRDPRDGTVLDTLPAPTTSLDKLDKAAADLSARVVPSVKTQLDALAKAAVVDPNPPADTRPAPTAPAVPVLPAVMIAVSTPFRGEHLTVLRDAIGKELPAWAHRLRREPKVVPAEQLARKQAVKTVDEARAEAGISFEVLAYVLEQGAVPMARARVRVRIADRGEVKFERVVRTDTIVGDRGSSHEEVTARTAREVLAIVRPHLRRAIATWR